MAWKTPRIVEIAVGMEINSYASADLIARLQPRDSPRTAAMRAVVLGAAAGGGFPQWNSNAEACRRARAGETCARPADPSLARRERRWRALVPDQRLPRSSPADPGTRRSFTRDAGCAPRRSKASSSPAPMSMRSPGCCICANASPSPLYATERVLAVLDGQSDLRRAGRRLRRAARRCRSAGRSSRAMSTAARAGWQVELFDVPGKVALYLERAMPRHDLAGKPGDTVGVEVARRRAAAALHPGLRAA